MVYLILLIDWFLFYWFVLVIFVCTVHIDHIGRYKILLFYFRVRLFHWKWLSGKYFSKNDLREKYLRKKKREKREIKIRKMFFTFQIRKTFYRKMTLFSVDQENIFSWLLIFRESNTRKCWKHFPESHFQWNNRTLNLLLILFF